MVVCLSCVVVSIAVRLGLNLTGHASAAYVLTPARMDGLAVGSMLALVGRHPDRLRRLLVPARIVMVATLLVLITIFVRQKGFDREQILVQTIG